MRAWMLEGYALAPDSRLTSMLPYLTELFANQPEGLLYSAGINIYGRWSTARSALLFGIFSLLSRTKS